MFLKNCLEQILDEGLIAVIKPSWIALATLCWTIDAWDIGWKMLVSLHHGFHKTKLKYCLIIILSWRMFQKLSKYVDLKKVIWKRSPKEVQVVQVQPYFRAFFMIRKIDALDGFIKSLKEFWTNQSVTWYNCQMSFRYEKLNDKIDSFCSQASFIRGFIGVYQLEVSKFFKLRDC